MLILPVIDLLRGEVVRGVAGRRAEYRPIASTLCEGSRPADVARAFVERLGFASAYVADLDAIGGAPPARDDYQAIAHTGLQLLVDAGVRDASQALAVDQLLRALAADVQSPVSVAGCVTVNRPITGPDRSNVRDLGGVVAGLETVASPEIVAEMLAKIGPRRLVFSLDLNQGRPLTSSPAWGGADAWRIARRVLELGVRRMIVLDLARVGVGEGVGTEDLCRQMRAADQYLEIIAGGGVRGRDDLKRLADAGCDAALVASALHDGRIATDTVLGERPM